MDWLIPAASVLLLTMFIGPDLSAQEKNRVLVGMSLEEFRRVHPKVAHDDAKSDGQWRRPEKLCGLEGSWCYTFKDGKLDWALWDIYIDELNQTNFDKCLKGTRQLIEAYTKNYGKPFEVKEPNPIFKDPHKTRHWGYDVLYAKWQTPSVKFKIGFDFMGGKGDYHFLVKMGFFRPDYPYFE